MPFVELSLSFATRVKNDYCRAGQMRKELSFTVFIMINFAFHFCEKRINVSSEAVKNGNDICEACRMETEYFVRYGKYE